MITGQRKDQSPGTRSEIPIVQVDPVFEGLDGGAASLVKWNPLANVEGVDGWTFLGTMDVPVNALHAQGYVSIGLHKGNIKEEEDGGGARDIRKQQCGYIEQRRDVLKLDNRKEPWLVVLYAPWCPFCQAMEARISNWLRNWRQKVLRLPSFEQTGDQKEFAKQELQLGTILVFPKTAPRAIKYPSEHRDIDMSFVKDMKIIEMKE